MVGESPNDRNDRGLESIFYLLLVTHWVLFSFHMFVNIFSDLDIFSLEAIRVATQWYQRHLGRNTKVMLITNDKDNKKKATEEGLSAETGILFTFSM
jgi:hypothetical protein